ncbi:MAG: hypothetical protein K2R98_07735 [Gemmataceae bacterium]|nr:hypothetical protein [Gemmataceae bacterium]
MTDFSELVDLAARVVFFPVRHHSPACARQARALIRRLRPAAVLIEGPSDFNDRIDELALPHRLPIAIYSYVLLPNGNRRGAYYPFCVYSPEWQALAAAREVNAAARFIDLPWADVAAADAPSHRYADGELRRSRYVASLCRRLGVESFDALWDTLFEVDANLAPEEFLKRCHAFCLHCRLLDAAVSDSDQRREAFMAAEVRQALEQYTGSIVVVTGGYHSSALHARLHERPLPGTDTPDCTPRAVEGPGRGIALTPYSYERLDSLVGYEAGMPNPGFYHQFWHDREAGRRVTHRELLRRVAAMLRERKQQISAADLIAAETTAQALAALRGHAEVWRWDLLDGIAGALVKEELSYGCAHPLLDAVHEVFRGGERGMLAEGTTLPPLVTDLRQQLQQHDLEPLPRPRDLEVDLAVPADRARSQLLHRMRVLGIVGFRRDGGTDIVGRADLATVREQWHVQWSPDYEATSIEASRYGPTLVEAASERLGEDAKAIERDAEKAALLLLDAGLAGLDVLAGALLQTITALIRGDGDFFKVSAALNHLLYLYRYDSVLQTAGRPDLGTLLAEGYARSLWLLEGLGQAPGRDRELLRGVQSILEAFERCGQDLALDREDLVAVLRRVARDTAQGHVPRGAAIGGLWSLGAADASEVRADLLRFADPARLGDFLTGLFCLAREAVQRHPDLVLSLDQLLVGYADEEFLEALPSLRLAFTYFTPREKHHMALTLLETLGLKTERPLTALEVSQRAAAQALGFEARLYGALQRFGIRGVTGETK